MIFFAAALVLYPCTLSLAVKNNGKTQGNKLLLYLYVKVDILKVTKSKILTKLSCLNKGLECSSNLENVIIRTTFFCNK